MARVALDAHHPSDVFGGLLAGIGVLAAFAILVPHCLPATHGEVAEPLRRTDSAAATGQDIEHPAHAGQGTPPAQ